MSCLFLRGEFFVKDSPLDCFNSPCPLKASMFRRIGNVSQFTVNIDSEIIGKENKFHRINPSSRVAIYGVDLGITIESVSKENLIDTILSDAKNSVGHKTEVVCIDENDFVISSFIPKNITIELLSSTGSLIKILDENDYILDGSKIILKNKDGAFLRLDYDYDSNDEYTPLLSLPKYKEIFFKGTNISSGKKVEARFFRVLFKPIENLDLISQDNFNNLQLSASVEESSKGFFKLFIYEGDDEFREVNY